MVRKIVTICILAMVCCLPMASTAFAYTAYEDGNISTTYVTYFDDIVEGLPVGSSYVAFRGGQYSYYLFASTELKHESGQFVADTGTLYTITVGSGYNSTYNYDVSTISNFTLDANSMMVYSNLGDYPLLDERGSVYEYGILLALVVCGIACLIRPLFKYVLRVR